MFPRFGCSLDLDVPSSWGPSDTITLSDLEFPLSLSCLTAFCRAFVFIIHEYQKFVSLVTLSVRQGFSWYHMARVGIRENLQIGMCAAVVLYYIVKVLIGIWVIWKQV